MNIEKISAFSLIGLMLFSECSGMDENPNFQQPDQQMQEINQEEEEEENNEVRQFMERFTDQSTLLSESARIMAMLVDTMLRSVPAEQRQAAQSFANEVLSEVLETMEESINQIMSHIPDEILQPYITFILQQFAEEEEEVSEEEEQQFEPEGQEQLRLGEEGEQRAEPNMLEQLRLGEQNQEAHEEEEQQLAGGNQLPAVNGGYYYPARDNGSFIENLGLLLSSDEEITVQWQRDEGELIKGHIGKGSNAGKHGDYLTVFVYWPDAPQNLRGARTQYPSKPVVRVKFKYGKTKFDTGAVIDVARDYRNDMNLGIPFGLMHNLFPSRFG